MIENTYEQIKKETLGIVQQTLKMEGVPCYKNGRKKDSPELVFAIKGVTYEVFLWTFPSDGSIRNEFSIESIPDYTEYTKKLDSKDYKGLKDWIINFKLEREVEAIFDKKERIFSKSLFNVRLPERFKTKTKEIENLWMKEFRLNSLDELEIFLSVNQIATAGRQELSDGLILNFKGHKTDVDIKIKNGYISLIKRVPRNIYT